ncbi:hypothetical protein BTA51_13325 [Hahella sp. CCB-MM4]|nr:hypothetical protein BTA51_13325 [Hahella sp. CCB-MM4]
MLRIPFRSLFIAVKLVKMKAWFDHIAPVRNATKCGTIEIVVKTATTGIMLGPCVTHARGVRAAVSFAEKAQERISENTLKSIQFREDSCQESGCSLVCFYQREIRGYSRRLHLI